MNQAKEISRKRAMPYKFGVTTHDEAFRLLLTGLRMAWNRAAAQGQAYLEISPSDILTESEKKSSESTDRTTDWWEGIAVYSNYGEAVCFTEKIVWDSPPLPPRLSELHLEAEVRTMSRGEKLWLAATETQYFAYPLRWIQTGRLVQLNVDHRLPLNWVGRGTAPVFPLPENEAALGRLYSDLAGSIYRGSAVGPAVSALGLPSSALTVPSGYSPMLTVRIVQRPPIRIVEKQMKT